MRPGADTWIHLPDLTDEEWRQIRRLSTMMKSRAATAAQAATRADQATEALRGCLLAVLEHRGLPVSAALRDRVGACNDPDILHRWLLQALAASHAEDVGT